LLAPLGGRRLIKKTTRLKRLSRDQDGRSEALHGVVASGID